jgi:N-carbamoyl-L-amino-acid hydrolase
VPTLSAYVARCTGDAPELPAVGTGSHIDAIPNAGRYDGTVGVLGGLEAIRALQRSGFRPHRSIELLIFTAEEPTLFGIGCLGSRFLAGRLDATAGERLRDAQGRTLNQIREAAGFTGPLDDARLPAGHYAAFVELHIEQGPLLESAGVPVGIVTAIAAPAAVGLIVEGEGGHAGAVLMPDRHDAFLAASEIALALERSARSTGARDTVATAGVCEVFPGAINSIPSRWNSISAIPMKRAAIAYSTHSARSTAEVAARRPHSNRDHQHSAPAVTIPPSRLHQAACRKHQLRFQKMVSRAPSRLAVRLAPPPPCSSSRAAAV